MHVGVTGTRNGATLEQKRKLKAILQLAKYLHHGACVGVDEQAHDTFIFLHNEPKRIIIYPPKSEKFISTKVFNTSKGRSMYDGPIVNKKRDYLVRNRMIVNSVDLMAAFPFEMQHNFRSGTWYTIRYAKTKRVPCLVVFPDGFVELWKSNDLL